MDLLPLLLLFLFLSGIQPVKGKHTINEGYLSADTGTVYRGLFAIVVVFHHLSQRTESGLLFQLFEYVGYPAVSVFFFLSGYGFQKSHINSEKYKHTFLQRRFAKAVIPYAAVTVLYWVFYAVGGKRYALQDIFAAILKGRPIVDYSWYMICMFHFYVAFWISMHICKKNAHAMVLCAGIWYMIYAIACRKLEYGYWWYNSPHLLIFGMIWAIYEPRMVNAVTKYYPMMSTLIPCGFVVTFITGIFYTRGLLSVALMMLSAVLFVLIFILFSLKVAVRNPIFRFLGNISGEIYLIHGLLILALRSERIYIRNELVWCLAVVSGSILLGWALHGVFSTITKALFRSRGF